MRLAKHFIVAGSILAIVLNLIVAGNSGAEDPLPTAKDSSHLKLSADDYRELLDALAAERKHIDELEKEVRELEASNNKLAQSQSAIATDTSQTQKQVAQIEKTLGQQLGPFQFGDRINSLLGQHTFSLVGSVATGFGYSQLANTQ